MTDSPQEPIRPEPPRADPPIVSLPKWIPIGLGVVLLTLALLAVYTGLNYRNNSLSRGLRRASGRLPSRIAEAGVPGEPQPGASRVVHGEHGETIPQPNALEAEESAGNAIRSDKGAVIPVIRLAARRGLLIRVTPADAMVYVNGQPIGAAKQFSTSDQIYEFADEGRYTVRLVAPGYHEIEYEVSAEQEAADEVALINTKLKKL